MSQRDNTNRGAIWKNEKKEKDTHPDFTGSINVDGREYWVSAWKRKEGAAAKAPALSFSVKPKDEQQSISDRAMPKGVSSTKYGFMARVTKNGKTITLGTFPTPESADTIVRQARKDLFNEFA